jgi:hypothetical protein
MSDLTIVSSIVIFLTCLTFLNLLLPVAWQFISITSLTIFGLSTVGVSAFCVVLTGIPCAIALGVSVGAQFVAPTVLEALGITSSTTYTWINTLILIPISIILSIFIARLARGVAGGG